VLENEVYRVVDADSGVEIAGHVRLAHSLRDRLFGLAGKTRLDGDSGLWLNPCNGIHTFGMRFPIRVVVLDRDNRVLMVVAGLKPNRILLPRRRGFSTLELPVSSNAGIRTGSKLIFELKPNG